MDNYFLTVAIAAHRRGFSVTPLRGKRPFIHGWNRHPLVTETEIATAAKEYPTYDVGIVLKRQIGQPFVIDIDNAGVIERLSQETGKTLPSTYIVATRPMSSPHKCHIFFRHTPYSYSKFDKNVNAGEYDLIGTGSRALQVVSEGCIRQDTGEVRSGNGLPIADCPDWLADWLVADSRRLTNERAAAARRRRMELKKVEHELAERDAVRRRNRTGYDKHGREDRYRYLLSKARTLSNAGVNKERLLGELLMQYEEDYGCVRDDDPNGWSLSELKQKIRSIVQTQDLKRGNPPPIRPRKYPGSKGSIIIPSPESTFKKRVKMARNFPVMMSSNEVYSRLGMDSKNPRDKRAVSRVMKAGGFKATRGRHSAIWSKVGKNENGGWEEARTGPPSCPHALAEIANQPETA